MKKEQEFNRSLRLILKSSFIVFGGILVSKILGYLYRIIIARGFGPEAYGLFSLAIMLSGWILIFSEFGLGRGLLRFIPIYRGKKDKKKIRFIFRSVLLTLIITGTIGGIILFLLADIISVKIFGEEKLVLFLKLFSIMIPFSLILSAFLATLKAHEKIGWSVFLSRILETSLKIILILFFIYLGFGLNSLIFSYVLAIILTAIVGLIIFKKYLPYLFVREKLKETQKRKVFLEVVAYSWPLLFAGVIWRVFEWTDSFVIGVFQTATDVGVYNVALPIALLLLHSTQIFMALFFPLVTKAYSKKNNNLVKQLSQQIGKWILAINLPIFVIFILFPGAIINILFGSEYVIAENSLRILSVGALFMSIFGISTRLIFVTGKSKIILYDILFVSIINLILNIVLVPKYGIEGAALSTSLSFIFLSILFSYQANKYLSILPLRRKMINLVVAVTISSLLLIYLRSIININLLSLIVLSIFFFSTYILIAFLLKSFDKNDIMIIRSIFGKFKK